MRPRRGGPWPWIVLGVILVVAGVVGAIQFRGGVGPVDPPSDATPPVTSGSQAVAAEPSSAAPAGAHRYAVVSSESEARYRVGETFFNVNREAVAVGMTETMSGQFSVDLESGVASGVIRVDISQLTSNQPRRDRAIRERWLESERFPTAEFRPTALELPDSYQEGEEIPAIVQGELTVRDVTRPATWKGSLVLEEDGLRASLSTEIRMTDFGFEPPSILGVLRAEDEATLEVELVARRSAMGGRP